MHVATTWLRWVLKKKKKKHNNLNTSVDVSRISLCCVYVTSGKFASPSALIKKRGSGPPVRVSRGNYCHQKSFPVTATGCLRSETLNLGLFASPHLPGRRRYCPRQECAQRPNKGQPSAAARAAPRYVRGIVPRPRCVHARFRHLCAVCRRRNAGR